MLVIRIVSLSQTVLQGFLFIGHQKFGLCGKELNSKIILLFAHICVLQTIHQASKKIGAQVEDMYMSCSPRSSFTKSEKAVHFFTM